MTVRSLPSGDPLADRLFGYAEAMMAEGNTAGVVHMLAQVVERVPDWAPAWSAMGLAEERLGRCDAAGAAFRHLDRVDPEGLFAAKLHLARLGLIEPPAAMPPSYVAALFDGYAATFDDHLVGTLDYRGPVLIRRELATIDGDRHYARGLDLGCGTGLMASAMGGRMGRIDGIDLSAEMAARATRTGLYRHVHVADIEAYLAETGPDAFDLVLAADVLVYMGKLDGLCGKVRRALAVGGRFGFTVQACTDVDVRLGPDLRFAHSARYLRRVLDAAGLDLLRLVEDSTRRERGAPVPGLIVVAAKS